MDADEKIDQILKEVGKINRGLYGDADNKVPGLMQEHYQLKNDFEKLNEKDKKRTWVFMGASAVISFISPFLWNWIKTKLGL